jgi:hypothetical protein
MEERSDKSELEPLNGLNEFNSFEQCEPEGAGYCRNAWVVVQFDSRGRYTKKKDFSHSLEMTNKVTVVSSRTK